MSLWTWIADLSVPAGDDAARPAESAAVLRLAPLALAVGYFLLSLFWIELSDQGVLYLSRDVVTVTALQAIKGIVFVAATSVGLYLVVGRLIHQVASTERRSAELAHRSDAILGALPDPVFLLDRSGLIRSVNRAVERKFGATPGALTGVAAVSLIDPSDQDKAFAALRRVNAGSVAEIVLKARTVDGPVAFRYRAAPLRDRQGDVIGVVGSARDITAEIAASQRALGDLDGPQENLARIVEAFGRLIQVRDEYTYGHQIRVARLACAIAEHMNLPRNRVVGLHLAAIIHDIGKVAVPAEILSKPGRLTSDEMAIMRRHPQVAYDILKTFDLPWPVADIVHQHHERLDGSGYPIGLHGGEICLEAKILAVADVVEAMASHRPYRPALGIERALAEITSKSGTLYDPAVVEACLTLPDIREFPA